MRGLDDQGAGERDTLLLAAGEFLRHARAEAAEADQVERAVHSIARCRAAHAAHVESEGNVALDRQMGEQRVVLKHQADVAGVRGAGGDVLTAEGDAAGGGRHQAGDDAQDGGLAAAGRSEQGNELAARDREVAVGDDFGSGAVALGDVLRRAR